MVSIIEIKKVTQDKKQYLDLLLLADEQEDMIDRYLERGEMFALLDGGQVRSIAVVTEEDAQTCELKNLATRKEDQGKGYGRAMVQHLFGFYKGRYQKMLVGTGDSPLTVPFYEKCGFRYSHRLKNFFTDHYDHPIFEAGKQLVDMVYFQKEL